MKVSVMNAKQTHDKLKILMNESNEFYWAVAWATRNGLSEILLKSTKRSKKSLLVLTLRRQTPRY